MQPELCVEPYIYHKEFPYLKRPQIIGFIGLENLKFARRIYEGRVEFDLNLHLDKAVRKIQGLDVKLNDLLTFLLKYNSRINILIERQLEKAPFFCYRGLMTCVACTPYEKKEPWHIVAILYKGTIFLCKRDTEEQINKVRNMTDKDKTFTSWGFKFEQFILSDTPDCEPNPNIPVNETEEFSLVFTTQLNQHRIIYGAEMDGIICDKETVDAPPKLDEDFININNYLSSKEFIELKTNRHLEFPNQETTFRRFKTKRWWCQSFLAAVDTILCGFRNDDGIVEELKIFNINDLPRMSKKFWTPNVCFNFLDTFFTYVKRCLAREIRHKHGERYLHDLQKLPMVTLLFVWNPGEPVRVVDNYNHADDPILPEWFIQSYDKKK